MSAYSNRLCQPQCVMPSDPMVKFKQLLMFGVVGLLAIACNRSTPNGSAVTEREESTPLTPPTLAEQPLSEATLQVYTEPTIPITTQYPDSFIAVGTETQAGVSLEFTVTGSDSETAKMSFLLPADSTTPVELEQSVTQPGGLFESNGWLVLEDSALVKRLNYPWMRTVIAFSGENDVSGALILGEVDTQTVQLIMLYPDAYAEDYWAAATIILDNLEFKSELLPVGQG
ncbi:MAG: hypothetical protein AAFY67_08885 [Cyanobacteria bacterium J06642_9]